MLAQGDPPPTPLSDNPDDPLYQLSCVAQKVLEFFDSQRLASVKDIPTIPGELFAKFQVKIRILKKRFRGRGRP